MSMFQAFGSLSKHASKCSVLKSFHRSEYELDLHYRIVSSPPTPQSPSRTKNLSRYISAGEA